MSLEDKVDRLTNTLERMLDQGSFSGGRNTGGTNTGGGNTGSGPSLTNGVNNAITSIGQYATGTANLTTVIGDVTKVMGVFGKAGEVVAGITSNVAGQLIQMNQNLMASSKFGITFGQDIGRFTEELGKAGISQTQWTQLLQNNSRVLSGTASTAEAAGALFLKQNQELMRSDTVLKARIAGIDFSEFQDQLLVSTNLFKFNNIGNERTQKILQDSVIQTTIEIDNMSRITAKSRQEIQKGVEQQTQSNTMRIARMAMSAEELARYEASLPMITQYGKTFGDLFTEMSGNRGNIVSKEGGEISGAIEAIAPGVTSLMRQLSTEQNADTRKELETRIQYELSKGASNEGNMRQVVALAKRNDPVSQKIVELLTQGEGMFGAGKEFFTKSDGTFGAFRAAQNEVLANAKKAKEDIGDKAPPGAQLSQVINAAEAATKSISAGLAMGIKAVADKAGESLKEHKLQNDYLKILTLQRFGPDELAAKLKEKGYTGVNTQDTTARPNIPGMPWMTNPPSNSNPLPVRNVDPTRVPQQAEGSKNTFGSWFGQDWGMGGLSMLHGKEAVVPEGKIGEFLNDMVAQQPNLIAGLQGSLRNTVSENNPRDAIEKMMQQFTSAVNVPATVSPSSNSNPISGTIMAETKTTSDLHTSLEKLNTKIDKLITAVEDSGNANVKAVKSRSNMIA